MIKVVSLKEKIELRDDAIKNVLKYSKYEYITSNNNLNYLILDGDEIIGEIDYSYPLDSVDLLYIYIDAKYRGKGFSKLLIEKTIEELKKMNVKEIFLEVSRFNNVAISLYQSLNFIQIGIRKDYYGIGDDAMIMRLIIG